MKRPPLVLIAALLASLSLPSASQGKDKKVDANAPTMEANVDVPMRDGVILRADIFRPAKPGKYPVLMGRTPYNKNGLHGGKHSTVIQLSVIE